MVSRLVDAFVQSFPHTRTSWHHSSVWDWVCCSRTLWHVHTRNRGLNYQPSLQTELQRHKTVSVFNSTRTSLWKSPILSYFVTWYWESEYSVALFTFTYYRHNVIKSVGKSHRFVFPLSLRVSVEFIPFHGFIPCPPSLGGRMISSLHRFTFLLPVDHFTCGSNNARKKSKVFVQPDLSQAQSHRNNDKSNWSFGVKSFIKRRLKLVRSPLQWDASAGTVAVNGFLKEHGLWF